MIELLDKYKSSLLVALLSALCVYLLMLRGCEADERAQLVNSYENKLDTFRNEYNNQVATNQLIVDSYNSLRKVFKQTDSSFNELKRLVDKKTLSATVLESKTETGGAGKTVVVRGDDPVDQALPTYLFSRKTEWDSISVEASEDSTRFNYKAYNKFFIKQIWKRSGWLSKQSFVEVISLNPNTETIGLRSFKLKQTSSKAGISVTAGSDVLNNFKPAITIGLSYNIISF